MLNNFYVCGPTSMKLIPNLGALKKWYMHGQWVDVSCIQNQGQAPITHGLKSLDRFYNAMLPCHAVVLSANDEFKIFQHYMYFSSDRAAVGL